jgi:WD40 repeat protein
VAVHDLAFDPKGSMAVSAGGDQTVRLWNPQTGANLRTIPVGSVVYTVAADPVGKRVAAGTADGLTRLYESATGRLLATLWAGDADGWLAITPEGYLAGADATLGAGVWAAGGKPVPAERSAGLTAPGRVAAAVRGDKVPDPAIK